MRNPLVAHPEPKPEGGGGSQLINGLVTVLLTLISQLASVLVTAITLILDLKGIINLIGTVAAPLPAVLASVVQVLNNFINLIGAALGLLSGGGKPE